MADTYFDALISTGDVPADVAAFLTGAGKTGTLAHIREVAAEARRLAERFGVDVEAAATAAWCHDLAAVVPRGEIVAVAEAWGVSLTEADHAVPGVIHGPLAAAVVRTCLGITDEDTLNAIRHHTTLRAGASPLEAVVFVADKVALDPASPRNDFLPALRLAKARGLDAMAFVYLDWVMQHGESLGWTIHANVKAAHAELQQHAKGILSDG